MEIEKKNDYDFDIEVEVVDEYAELEQEYISKHGLAVNNSFKDQMKKLFENKRKQITSMSQEIRNLKREQHGMRDIIDNMEERMLETLRELKREQCKTGDLSFLQKELMQNSSLLSEKERQIKLLEQTVQENDKLIAKLKKEAELNKAKLLEEKAAEKLSPETAKKIAHLESEIIKMTQEEEETQRVAAEQQKLVSNYNAVIRKISRHCNKVLTDGKHLKSPDSAFNSTLCNEGVQDQRIESSTYTLVNAEESERAKRKKSSSFQIDENLEIDNSTKIDDPKKCIANVEITPISNNTEKISNKIFERSSSLDNSRKLQLSPSQHRPSLQKLRSRKSTGMETENPQKCIPSKISNISEIMSCSQADTRRSTSTSPKIGKKRRISLTHDKCTSEKCTPSKISNISEVISCSQADTRRSTCSSPKIREKVCISLTRDKCTRESAHLQKHNKSTHTITKSDTAKPFHVDRILDREMRGTRMYYRVSWEGYDIRESTWEPRINLIKDVPHIVKQVETAQKPATAWKKYCICNGFDDGTVMMFCDKCKEWFHASCLKIDPNVIVPSENWYCRSCDPLKMST